ncbi:MAG: hypothetical protein DMF79_14660, partial [Acidobacteria bacterium]
QVGQGLGQVSLLAEHEPQDAVRVGVALVQAEGLGELVLGTGQLAALGGGEGALVGVLRRAFRIGCAGRRRRRSAGR